MHLKSPSLAGSHGSCPRRIDFGMQGNLLMCKVKRSEWGRKYAGYDPGRRMMARFKERSADSSIDITSESVNRTPFYFTFTQRSRATEGPGLRHSPGISEVR